MGRNIYELNQIRHYYGDKKVLDLEHLSIEKGSITGLSGPNGSGKSTLLKIMAFAIRPSRGDIRFKGRIEVPLSPGVRSKVTLLTQKPYLLKRSVFDNIIYGLKIRKDKDNLKSRVKTSLETVGLDHGEFYRRKWHELSGGEAQRVAMAARLILKPEVLLLDEPVASVDVESARLIRQASLAARDNWGCTLVIVSHDLAWLNEASDTRLSMSGGRVFSTGTESIIPQPYTSTNQEAAKVLSDGQRIRLSCPGKNGKTAVIKKEKILICLEKDMEKTFDNQITGEITSMLLEKKTGNSLTTISLADISLVFSFPIKKVFSMGLRPGKRLVLKFNSEDISWR